MDIQTQFPLNPEICHLNHAAVAPWPKVSVEAVQQFAYENMTQGSKNYRGWLKIEQELRQRAAELINAPSTTDIALLKNTSEGLSVIAYGLHWKPGDNIVTTNQEFPSNRIVWESLGRFGVELRQADIGQEDPEQALFDQVDEQTRLITVSSVQYATGLRMDLERIGAFCREQGILFCVDAIQSLGALPFDVEAIQADFVVADGHKWMLGPEGLAIFYVREKRREQLKLHQFGWHMVENAGDFDAESWRVAQSGMRFECGSPNMLGAVALHASLGLLLDYGLDNVAKNNLENSAYLIEKIKLLPNYNIKSNIDQFRRSAIVTFSHATLPAEIIHQKLTELGVICAPRGGGVRLSPHFYTPRDQLDRCLRFLEQIDQAGI